MGRVEQIKIFHTNDLHSCFDHWSQINCYLKKNRAKDDLYIDLGDHTDRSHPMTEATLGKGNVQLLNAAKVDYVTFGNNEGITFSKEDLEKLYEKATFPVILANLFHEDGVRPSWMKKSMIHTSPNGLKIGFIGLTAPFSLFYKMLGWKVGQPKDILKNILPTLRKEVDVVVLLSHLGLYRDEEIAAEFEGIDVIIGAHTHHTLPEGKRVIGTLIAQTGKLGSYLGEVTIGYDFDERQVVNSEATLIDMSKCDEDQKTNELLTELSIEADKLLSERVVNLPRRLAVSWYEESELPQLLCNALTEWCEEEIGMMNAGVLLESLEEGWVTKRDLHRICPHPINPCVVKISGEQLKKTIERAFTSEIINLELKGFGFRGKVLGEMIFTGIKVHTTEDQEIRQIDVSGKPLQLHEVYSIATLDMYTFGYLFPHVAEAKVKNYFIPEFLRDVLTWKLQKDWK